MSVSLRVPLHLFVSPLLLGHLGASHLSLSLFFFVWFPFIFNIKTQRYIMLSTASSSSPLDGLYSSAFSAENSVDPPSPMVITSDAIRFSMIDYRIKKKKNENVGSANAQVKKERVPLSQLSVSFLSFPSVSLP